MTRTLLTTEDLFEAIVNFKMEHDGCSPTYAWLKEECRLASTSTVSYHVEKLVKQGRLVRGPGKGDLKVVGGVWRYSSALAHWKQRYHNAEAA